jgi:hypothetical protein
VPPRPRPMANGVFEVQRRQCATCIYRDDSSLNIENLEAQIRDTYMEGYFSGFRVCHHSSVACCAGFWARHKDHFTMGQIAQRLGLVRKVDHDTIPGPRR